MKKPLFLFISLLLFSFAELHAQQISAADLKKLQQKEDSLKQLVKNVYVDSLTAGRMRSDSQFVKTLVRSLLIKNSFYFPFDSVQGVSKIYSPDSLFRIFSWSISYDDFYSRQKGAIQFKTANGSLKLVPLMDYYEFTPKPLDSVRTNRNWIGAVYYNMIKTEHNGKNYYTLFGFDDHSVRTSKKWIDVLHFDAKGQPQFGVPFTFENDSIKRPVQYRHSIEYKKEASTYVNYDSDLKMIILDHLISETDEPDKAYTMVPDGDQEAFVWKGGKWVHIDKAFDFKLEDGQAPIPDPIRDGMGTNNEQKLKERSEKNKTKKGGN